MIVWEWDDHFFTGRAAKPAFDADEVVAVEAGQNGFQSLAASFVVRAPEIPTEDDPKRHYPLFQLVRGDWSPDKPGNPPGGGVYVYVAYFPKSGTLKVVTTGGGWPSSSERILVPAEWMRQGVGVGVEFERANADLAVSAFDCYELVYEGAGEVTNGSLRHRGEHWGVAADLPWHLRLGGKIGSPDDRRTIETVGWEFGDVDIRLDEPGAPIFLQDGWSPWWAEPQKPPEPEPPPVVYGAEISADAVYAGAVALYLADPRALGDIEPDSAAEAALAIRDAVRLRWRP